MMMSFAIIKNDFSVENDFRMLSDGQKLHRLCLLEGYQ